MAQEKPTKGYDGSPVLEYEVNGSPIVIGVFQLPGGISPHPFLMLWEKDSNGWYTALNVGPLIDRYIDDKGGIEAMATEFVNDVNKRVGSETEAPAGEAALWKQVLRFLADHVVSDGGDLRMN